METNSLNNKANGAMDNAKHAARDMGNAADSAGKTMGSAASSAADTHASTLVISEGDEVFMAEPSDERKAVRLRGACAGMSPR